MAAAMKVIMSLLLALLVLVAMAPGGEAQIGCDTVRSSLVQCIPYVINNGPLGTCCNGVKGLFSAAKTPSDRRSVCNCLKDLAQTYYAYIKRAASLPGQCGITIPYKISRSTDCSKVN